MFDTSVVGSISVFVLGVEPVRRSNLRKPGIRMPLKSGRKVADAAAMIPRLTSITVQTRTEVIFAMVSVSIGASYKSSKPTQETSDSR